MARIGNENCIDCSLYQYREEYPIVKNLLIESSEILIYGMCPGKDEVKQGIPFVGASGQKLNTAFLKIGWNREYLSFANALLCFLPKNINVTKEMIKACRYNLIKTIRSLPNLKMVVPLGEAAIKSVLNKYTNLKIRDYYCNPFKIDEFKDILFVANYHPAYTLYNPSLEKDKLFFDGFKKIDEIFQSLKIVNKKLNHIKVLNEETLTKILVLISKQKQFAIDFETTSLITWRADLLSIHISWESKTAISIPYKNKVNGRIVPFWNDFLMNEIKKTFINLFSDDVIISGQNIKYDSLISRKEFGVPIPYKFDVMLSAFTLDSSRKVNLDALTTQYFPEHSGYSNILDKYITKGKKEDGAFADVPMDVLLEYGALDVDIEFRLTNLFVKELNRL